MTKISWLEDNGTNTEFAGTVTPGVKVQTYSHSRTVPCVGLLPHPHHCAMPIENQTHCIRTPFLQNITQTIIYAQHVGANWNPLFRIAGSLALEQEARSFKVAMETQ